MRALTITQPWLWFITSQVKRVENRRYNTSHRGPLALHAGARPDTAMIRAMRDEGWLIPTGLPTGAVVATCDLIDVHPAGDRDCRCNEWAERDHGNYHWVLANVQTLLTPIECHGARRLWTLPEHLDVLR